MTRGSGKRREKKGRKEREREKKKRNSENETLDTAPRTVIPGNSMKYSHVQMVAWFTNNYIHSVEA